MHADLGRIGRPPVTAIALVGALLLAAQASADPTAAPGDPDTVVLNVAGDIAYPNGWGGIEYIDKTRHELFRLVQPILDGGDLNFANIECPLTDAEPVAEKTYPIACKRKRMEYFTEAGFNLLSLANNHSTDVGAVGIADTLAALAAASTPERPLYHAGTGADSEQAGAATVVTVPGKNLRIAFFAVASGSYRGQVASLHDPALGERIAAAKRSADIVAVSVHHGPEYVHVPPKGTVDKYHGLIDAGADLVIGHHPHVVQGVERYRHGVIFYSLGNFSFGSRTRRHLATGARLYSMIGRITLRRGAIAQVELIPLYANNRWNWTLGDLTLEPLHATPQQLSGAFADFALTEFEDFTERIPTTTRTRLVRVGGRALVALDDDPPDPVALARLRHEQRHEYAVVRWSGAAPRPATEAEKRVQGRAGTLDDLVREAQRQAAEEAAREARKQRRGGKGKKGAGKGQKGKKGKQGASKGKAGSRRGR